ncbi:MAG: C40 family peptidase [Amnibacterium sp.]
MTFTDVVSAIQRIQSQLAALSPAPPASADSGAAFADALAGAGATPAATTPSATASTDGTLLDTNGVTGDDVVRDAEKYLGVPYVLGGESTSGMDCSGLVQRTFADLGVSVPRLVHEQQTVGQPVGSLAAAKPGDLVVLNGGDHIAIYAGNGMVVHAPYEGRTVSLQKAWFTDKDIVTIRRIVPATGDATSTSGTAVLEAMYGGGAAGDASLSGLVSSLGASGSSSTAQQLLAARAALAGVAG